MQLPNVGKVFAAIPYGETLEFWCHSLDGDSTDSRIITLDFADEITVTWVSEFINGRLNSNKFKLDVV